VAPEGHVLLAAVYGQVEVRVMAHMSQARGVTWGCYVVYVGM
jgi:DNA polymerase I-like protein with 3'-5' exonuclease and polymerase domains